MKKRLGKGLDALLSFDENENGIEEVNINSIEPNSEQPRKEFNSEKLAQLAESIKQHGVVQPIIVKKESDTLNIIAGERRWRAARIAGLKTMPVIIREYSKRQVLEIALIENIQREDLNAIEEALAYESLIKEYGLTQEEISDIIGRSRSAVANTLRMLKLEQKVKELIIDDKITSGHARALLSLDDAQMQKKTAMEIINKGMSVRQTEKLVNRLKEGVKKKKAQSDEEKNMEIEIRNIEDKLKNHFGTKVKLHHGKNKGRIVIEYYSDDELERLLEMMGKKINNR